MPRCPKKESPPALVRMTPKRTKRLEVNKKHFKVIKGPPQMYKCRSCKKTFKTKAHIKYHEFSCWKSKDTKPFKCDQCGEGFITNAHFQYHLSGHSGEEPYQCQQCFKGFKQRGKLNRHMKIHTGDKPFQCDLCPKTFSQAQGLQVHRRIHTGEKPYSCGVCKKQFTNQSGLRKHSLVHSGERSWKCGKCDKAFGLKWTLDLHKKTHAPEESKRYRCELCPRRFHNRKDLLRHVRVHTKEKPFQCSLCTMCFNRKDNLGRHIRGKHRRSADEAKQLADNSFVGDTPSSNEISTSPGRVLRSRRRLQLTPKTPASMKKEELTRQKQAAYKKCFRLSTGGKKRRLEEDGEEYADSPVEAAPTRKKRVRRGRNANGGVGNGEGQQQNGGVAVNSTGSSSNELRGDQGVLTLPESNVGIPVAPGHLVLVNGVKNEVVVDEDQASQEAEAVNQLHSVVRNEEENGGVVTERDQVEMTNMMTRAPSTMQFQAGSSFNGTPPAATISTPSSGDVLNPPVAYGVLMSIAETSEDTGGTTMNEIQSNSNSADEMGSMTSANTGVEINEGGEVIMINPVAHVRYHRSPQANLQVYWKQVLICLIVLVMAIYYSI